MEKAIFKIYIKSRFGRKLIVKAEIYDDVEKTVEEFHQQLDDRSKTVITFGRLSFNRDLYHSDELHYKG